MAVYFTLAVDCADNQSAADEIATRFSDHEIELNIDGNSELIKCTALSYTARKYWNKAERENLQLPSWHLACVTQEVYLGGPREDLCSEANLRLIRNNLYDRLAGINTSLAPATGFRAARFGFEAQDSLGGDNWLQWLGQFLLFREPKKYYEGLILQESLVRNPSLRKHLSKFSPGYLWWDCFPKRFY